MSQAKKKKDEKLDLPDQGGDIEHADQPASYAITQEVDGETVEYLVTPGHTDPIPLRPSKRDTLEKDAAARG